MPAQSVGAALPAERQGPRGQGPEETTALIGFCQIAPGLLDEFWQTCEAELCGLSRGEFEQIVLGIGMARNFGLEEGLAAEATPRQQAEFFATLRMADLVLARACSAGSERAWERFIALFREPLLRAGIAITGNESLGRELADGLYAELYGLTVRDGERRSPLDSFSGRGSLIGWLRTTLAQRHVDRHRKTHREQPLEETGDCSAPAANFTPEPNEKTLPLLTAAVREALEREGPEEKFLLASYYLDGRKLHEIASLLGVHEATVSRKLKRATTAVRKRIVRSLEQRGMRRREIEELLQADPRDLTAAEAAGSGPPQRDYLRLKELLQTSESRPFKEQAES